MTAATAERVMVRPAHMWQPPAARSLVTQVTKVCASVGRVLDEEQRLAVDVATGLKADGTPAALESVIISPRQNLKTFTIEGIALTLLLDPHNGFELGVWSAQEFDTSAETFRHFADLFESPDTYPHLARRVKQIKRGSGKEEIELLPAPGQKAGRRLKFKARSGTGGRGLTGDFVVLDEAFALSDAHMGALLPTLSTRRRAMVFYGSSAAKANSKILHALVSRGRAGGQGAPAYIEWCAPGSLADPGCVVEGCQHAPGTAGCSLDNEDFWLLANCAKDRRISTSYLRTERTALPVLEFARERMGWHEEPGSVSKPISMDLFRSRIDEESLIVGGITIGVDIPPSRTSARIGVAGFNADGKAHIELAWVGPVGDVVAQVAKMCAEQDVLLIQDGKPSPNNPPRPAIVGDKLAIGPLMPAFKVAGFTPVMLGTAELAEACGHLQDDFERDSICHPGQQELEDGFDAAVKRDLGDGGWLWGKKVSAAEGGDISGVVAVTDANWALSHHQPQQFFGARR